MQKGDAAEEGGGLDGIKARVGEGEMGRDGTKEERWREGGEGMKVKRKNGMFMKARCEEQGWDEEEMERDRGGVWGEEDRGEEGIWVKLEPGKPAGRRKPEGHPSREGGA